MTTPASTSDTATRAQTLAGRARKASFVLSRATTQAKNAALLQVAAALEGPARAAVLDENKADLAAAAEGGLAGPMLERLKLDDKRLQDLAKAVREIAALPDPVGAIDGLSTRPSGIRVGRMRIPLGVILIVYESRPNVTVDAAALCLKAGNTVVLRGGKEAFRTNRALARVLGDALEGAGLPRDGALFVDDTDRELLYALLAQSKDIDLAIPRGGTSLIDAVNAHARVPVLQHYQGICHVYVHASADLDTAERIIVNGKVQRPGVCNSLECVLVDASVASSFVPRVVATLSTHGVEVRGCERTRELASVTPAVDADWDTEFLELKIAMKVVDGYDDALSFIEQHGSRHTESIVAKDHDVAMRFLREVDASCVMINASTRFNDGGELGLGAELGISTTKLHAYGPMGLEELTARKFIVLGHGETRGTPP
jgi:glutamate-5-semialdehyde dehydrogenase